MPIIKVCWALEPSTGLRMLSIELCGAVPADKALLSCVPHGVFGGYFRINDFLQPGEAPPGLEQTFPSAPAKGGKGLSQEVSPGWLQNPKWFIACLSGSYFKSQWFIESNAHILYNEVVLQCCQHKSGTCCLFLLSSNPSKPTGAPFQFHQGTL